jgi:hypothetical protein
MHDASCRGAYQAAGIQARTVCGPTAGDCFDAGQRAFAARRMLSSLFGWTVVVGILALVQRAGAYRWRIVASAYADRSPRPAVAEKRLQKVTIFGPGRLFSSYIPVTVRIHEDGLSLRLLPPFSIFHSPIFLPFGDLKVKASSWYLNAESWALLPSRSSGMEIIVDGQLFEWIRASSGKI